MKCAVNDHLFNKGELLKIEYRYKIFTDEVILRLLLASTFNAFPGAIKSNYTFSI